MARYIDADVLEKSLDGQLKTIQLNTTNDDVKLISALLVCGIRLDIKNTPTADVVEVVRCKDCKWWKSNFTWNCKEVKVCVKDPFEPAQKEDFFCADGERKSE